MDPTQREDATNHGPQTDEKRNVPFDASAYASAIQGPDDESFEAVEVIFKDTTLKEDATNLSPMRDENQNVQCDTSTNALAIHEPDDESLWMFLDVTDVFAMDPTMTDDATSHSSTTDDATSHSPMTDESQSFPNDVSTNAPAIQEPNKSLGNTLDNELFESTDDFVMDSTQTEDTTNHRHEINYNRYIPFETSADTLAIQELYAGSLDAFEVFFVSQAQTEDVVNYGPEMDENRNIPHDASAYDLAIQETDDESLRFIDFCLINPSQTEDTHGHQLESVEDDLDSVLSGKMDNTAVEEASSLDGEYAKFDAPIPKTKRDPYSMKFRAVDKLRCAMKSTRLKEPHGENRNVPCDESAESQAIHVQKSDDERVDIFEAIYIDPLRAKGTSNHGPEMDEKRNVQCDAAADALATQKPEDMILNVDAVFLLDSTQAEDATNHQLVSAIADKAAVEVASNLAKHHPKSASSVAKANWDLLPVKFNKVCRAVKSPILKQFIEKKHSLISRKVFLVDERSCAIETTFMDPERTENSLNQQLETVECDLDSFLSTFAAKIELDQVLSLPKDDPKSKAHIMNAEWNQFPVKFKSVDKICPAVKWPIQDCCNINDGGQHLSLIDNPDGSIHFLASMNQAQTKKCHAIKSPRFDGLHRVHAHSSTSREPKLREDNISTKTSSSRLSFSDELTIKKKPTSKRRSKAKSKQVEETDILVNHDVVEKRGVGSKDGEGLHKPATAVLSDEVLLLRDMISQLQGKINEIDRIDKSSRPHVTKINDIKNTACCYFDDSPKWFASSGDLDSLSKTSSSCTESSSGDFSLTGKTCIESIDGVTSSFTVSTDGHLHLA